MSIKLISHVWEESPYEAKVLLIHLALADFADDDGSCWPNQKTISMKSRCTVKTVRSAIQKMVKDGQIEIVHQGGNGAGDNSKYRLVIRGNSFPPNEDGRGKPTTNKGEIHDQEGGNPASIEPYLIGFNRHIVSDSPEGLVEYTNSPSSSSVKSLQKTKTQIATEDQDFMEFYEMYPRKLGKAKAHESWRRAIKVAQKDEIISGAKSYAQEVLASEKAPNFILHATTWLNQEKWEDSVGQETKNQRFRCPNCGHIGATKKCGQC